jgi:hypothetical protein
MKTVAKIRGIFTSKLQGSFWCRCVHLYRNMFQFEVIYLFIHSFLYGIFNDAVSHSDYKASNNKKISERWLGKDAKGIGRGVILG